MLGHKVMEKTRQMCFVGQMDNQVNYLELKTSNEVEDLYTSQLLREYTVLLRRSSQPTVQAASIVLHGASRHARCLDSRLWASPEESREYR